jgi:hypothetical protein
MATRQEMPGHEEATMLDRISDGRTDLVFDYLAEGHVAMDKAIGITGRHMRMGTAA